MPENRLNIAPLENFLIVFKEDVSVSAIQRLAGTVLNAGGNVLLITGNGKTLIVTAPRPLTEGIRRLPYVRHVGGLYINQRKIVRKRV